MINQEMRTRHSVNQVTMRPAHVPLSKKKHPNRQGEMREGVCSQDHDSTPPTGNSRCQACQDGFSGSP